MNYCVVPSYDLDHDSATPKLPPSAPPNSSNSNVLSTLDYGVTELTWENGQLAMHGLGRGANRSAASPPWDKSLAAAAGTLESIVSQATTCRGRGNELQVPWFDHNNQSTDADAVANLFAAKSGHGSTMTMDALVPCQINVNCNSNNNKEKSGPCMMGSCSVAAEVAGVKDVSGAARWGMCGCGTNVSVSESATCGGGGGRDSRQMTVDGFTSTSLWSPENTSSGGGDCTKTYVDDLDHSVHSISQMESGDREGKRRLGVAKSSISTKRSRAAVHNQSERKRRDRINEKIKTLQKLVPNCSKTDKASMLDEVIEYLKQLQTQVNMMSRLNIPPMMLPLAFQQHQLQMSIMAGMGVMDINSIGRNAAAAMPPPPAAPFVPMPSWDAPVDRLSPPMIAPNDMLAAFLNRQSQQPMTMEAYSRLAALCQQFQQPPSSTSKN